MFARYAASDENSLASRPMPLRTPGARALGTVKPRAGTAKEASRVLPGASAGPSKGLSTDIGPQRLFKDAQSLLRDKTNKTPGRSLVSTSAVKLPQSASRRKALARAQLVISPVPQSATPLVKRQPIVSTPSPNPLVRARAAQLRATPSPSLENGASTEFDDAEARLAAIPLDAEVEYAGPSAIDPPYAPEPGESIDYAALRGDIAQLANLPTSLGGWADSQAVLHGEMVDDLDAMAVETGVDELSARQDDDEYDLCPDLAPLPRVAVVTAPAPASIRRPMIKPASAVARRPLPPSSAAPIRRPALPTAVKPRLPTPSTSRPTSSASARVHHALKASTTSLRSVIAVVPDELDVLLAGMPQVDEHAFRFDV